MVGSLTRQRFIDQMGSVFTALAPDGQSVPLTLVEVINLGSRRAGTLTIESYSLLFEGPLDPQLAQSSIEFVHPEMGKLVIFIVPLGPLDGSMRYEAIFN